MNTQHIEPAQSGQTQYLTAAFTVHFLLPSTPISTPSSAPDFLPLSHDEFPVQVSLVYRLCPAVIETI